MARVMKVASVFRTCSSRSRTSKAFEPPMNQGDVNPIFTSARQRFIVFTQATAFAQPGQGALHHPALRDDDQAVLGRVTPTEIHPDAEGWLHPVDQGRTVIAVIQQQQLPALIQRPRGSLPWRG